MKTLAIVMALFWVIIGAMGCAPAKKTTPAKSGETYDFQREKKAPPLDRSDVKEEADVEETSVAETPIVVEELDAPVDTVASAPDPNAARPTAEGFRIQVFASISEDVAVAAKRAAEARLGVPAYVEHVDGFYKVRVGDCLTREDAENLLARAKETYYRDAWIVAGTVYSDKPYRSN